MGEIRNHKDLDVWKKSIEFVKEIYQTTQVFPKEEMYCLTSQIRRAAVSIPSNLAEGAARKNKTEFKQFLLLFSHQVTKTQSKLKKKILKKRAIKRELIIH